MTTMTIPQTRLSLLEPCKFDDCGEFTAPLLQQLSNGYETCSVLPMPESLEEWRNQHRTARRRAMKAAHRGYRFAQIPRERHDDDIYQINTSLPHRQGRRMSPAYRERVHYMPLPEYPCDRHAIRTYGVLAGSHLVAYLWLYRCGDLALVSSILGHGDHLDNGIMFLLFQGVVGCERLHGGSFVYNRHDSGQDGLRQFKRWLGFEETEVQWAL